MESFTVVFCDLNDCTFYHPEPSHSKKCKCAHPEKPLYLKLDRCPLYRMDVAKKMRAAASAMKKPGA